MRDIPSQVMAVLSALQFQGDRREGLRTLTDSEWEDVLSLWEIRRLIIPLRQICGDDLPEWVRFRIDQNLADNAKRLERIKEDYSNFYCALQNAGAEHLVLKGFTQWPCFVEHPRFRLQSDIDVYCPPESILRAQDALAKLGYESERGFKGALADHLPPMTRKTSWQWRGNYYDPEMPVSFELHICLWNESTMRLRPRGLDRFWSRRIERRLDDIRFPALNAVDNFGYAALHLTRNLLRLGTSPYQAYELARFLHTNADNERFWKEWLETHDDSLRRLEAIACRLAFQGYACRLAKEVENEINCLPIAVEAWFNRFTTPPGSPHFLLEKDGLWLHLCLLECSSDQRSILRERLFPMLAVPIERIDLADISGVGQKGRHSSLWRLFRYLVYIVSRLAHHLLVLPSTLWRGVGFWWSTKTLGREFWKFFAASFLFDVGMFIFFFLYNLYLLDRGFREDFLGLVTSANAIGSVAGCIPGGMLVQRFGLQKALVFCLTLVSVVSASLALATSGPVLLVLSFFGGAFATIYAVVIAPAVTRLTNQQNRPFGFSLIFSSGIAVAVLGSETASMLPIWLAHIGRAVTALRAKQLTLLIGCVVVALAVWPALRIRFAAVPVHEKKLYPRNPFLFRFLAAIGVWSLVTGAFSPFFNAYFSQYLKMPLERIGMVTSVSQISQALAILVAPFILRKFGIVTGIMYTQVATAISLACLAAVPGASAAAVVYTAYTALQWMSEPGMYSLLMSQVTPSEQAGASALNFLVISLAQAIAAAAAGASFVRFGYPAVLVATAGVALVAAFLFRLLLGKTPVVVPEPVAADPGLG